MATTITLKGSGLIDAICKAQGIDSGRVRRIVVDAEYNNIARVYVEMAGTMGLLDVDWGDPGIEVKVLEAKDA